MNELAMALIPHDWLSEIEVYKILEYAFRTVDQEYGIREANLWADSFQFPPEVMWRDTIELGNCNWNLTELAKQKNGLLINDRFSRERLLTLWDKNDPDFPFLMDLAAGVPVWLDPDFIPTLNPPPLSPAYCSVSSVINKLCFEQWVAGQAIILPLSVLTQWECTHTKRVSFSGKFGWVRKHGTPAGRPTNNYSYDNHKNGLINTEEVKSVVKDFYGKIELAQLGELMEMVNEQVNIAHGNWSSISLWKMDLKGAFALLNFKPEDVGLLTMTLTGDLGFVSLVGNFGLSQYPFIFSVISRVLMRAIRKDISGDLRIFVDDLMGVCLLENQVSDMRIARSIVENLLGPYSVSEKKTFTGPILDWIGWEINLQMKTVTIADHNLYKTLYGFFNIQQDQQITVREIQRLASWAARYTLICRYMRPFTYYLFQSIKGRTHSEAKIKIEGSLWMVVQLWQIFLILCKLKPVQYARSIRSFAYPQSPMIWLSYDASLTGVGFILRLNNPELSETPREDIIAAVSYDTSYNIISGDSSYQNTMEFIAVMLGMFYIAQLGYRNINVYIIGDNTSSLHWCSHERFRGGRSNGSAIAFVILAASIGNEITAHHYITSEDNHECDQLSRGIRPRSLGIPRDKCPQLHRDDLFVEFAQLLDPTHERIKPEELKSFWSAIQSIVQLLLGEQERPSIC